MRDKEKARQYNLLYRQMHKVGIRIRDRLYKRLPHVKKKALERQRRYFPQYYKKHREEILKRAVEWNWVNKDRRRLICKRYKERLKRRKLGHTPKIKRILEEFIEYCKDRYKPDTVRQYKKNMGRFLKYIDRPGSRSKTYHLRRYYEHKKPPEKRDPEWSKDYQKIRLIEDIDKNLITNYVSYVNHDAVSEKTGLLLSQSEKESRLYPFKTFLLYCQKKGYLKSDLRKFIYVPPREKRVLKRVLTVEEMQKLLEAPNTNTNLGIRDRALLELSYSALRAEEMLSLKLSNVDVVTNSVTILNGKGDKDRVIPMTNEAIYWIKRWLARRHEFTKDGNEPEYLFITKKSNFMTRKNFSILIKKYAKKANILIDIAPHDLRRTTATHLAENGAPIRLIQALLGHATLKVTTKYLRLTDEKIKKEHKETHPANRRNLYYGKLQR